MAKFRNDVNQRFTRLLFWEEATTEKTYVLYTLKRQDYKGYPSIYRLYMEMEDTSEFDFANKYFEDYEHWQIICEADWMSWRIAKWRIELQTKLKARALNVIKDEAFSGSRSALQAAKFLLEKGWVDAKESKLSKKQQKEAIKNEAKRQSNQNENIQETMDRIGLKVIK